MSMDLFMGMYTVFEGNRALSCIFFVLLLLSILCQVIIGVTYWRLIRETDNMAAAKNKFLKQCKLKFINCYQLSGDVANVSVFVDKSMTKISFLGISMTGLHHLAGQFILLSVVTAGLGACQEITQGETLGKILPYYLVSFLGLYVYFSISGLVDITGKKERLKINLVDYLENHMANKLRQSDIDWQELTGESLSTAKGKIRKIHKKKKSAADNVDTEEKKKQLREGIGLSAERDTKESAKVMPFVPSAEQNAQGNAAEGTGDQTEEKAAAAFSNQDAQELEKLLKELLV